MELKNQFLLTLTGLVPANKQREFEQTFQLVFNQLPGDCLEYNLARDAFIPDHYYFFSTWTTAEALSKFSVSSEFQEIRGAFITMGILKKSICSPALVTTVPDSDKKSN